jgi:hypothetical protein
MGNKLPQKKPWDSQLSVTNRPNWPGALHSVTVWANECGLILGLWGIEGSSGRRRPILAEVDGGVSVHSGATRADVEPAKLPRPPEVHCSAIRAPTNGNEYVATTDLKTPYP